MMSEQKMYWSTLQIKEEKKKHNSSRRVPAVGDSPWQDPAPHSNQNVLKIRSSASKGRNEQKHAGVEW
jgi:hypothetical protein